MSDSAVRSLGPGPFSTAELGSRSRHELSDGHAIPCAPNRGDSARRVVAGGLVLDTDPDVDSTGFDAGFSPDLKNVRAPDIAVGNVPDRPGWIPGTPPLAVEYAGGGQDEAELTAKIGELLARGTQQLWVVRLLGNRRVEVHLPGEPVRTLGVGEVLTAPGILRNPVPVEALFDRNVAHEVAFRNLLQRHGYSGLDDVRAECAEEGREEGRHEAREVLRELVRDTLRARGTLTAATTSVLTD